MPSKFKKAIAAVKDQTSISLAKVGGAESASLEVAILKATTHVEVPVDERHVTEVLQHVSSNKSYAGSCARAIGRRIGRTRNWVVAVKSLVLVLRIFQDGDPHFPKEVLHAMKRGYKILNLASFRDDSTTSCPWDFTAFVRTFALYLDERLDCFLTGKLQRRTAYHHSGPTRGYSRKNVPVVRDMKPGVLLDRILHWQRLLDRAIATRPTGAAKTNRLVHNCLYAIVQETFELYRDISDGLALLLDSFFHLQYNNCVSAFQTCLKASKQSEELCAFYDLCKSIGVGRSSEYPSVQKVSDELIGTLQEFLKDQSSFPGTNGRTPGSSSLPPMSPKGSQPGSARRSNQGRSISEFGGSHCTSLEDLISADSGFSSPDRYSDPGRENPPQSDDFLGTNDNVSVRSDPTDHRGLNSMLDLLSLDGPSPPPELQVFVQGVGVESDRVASTSSPSQEGWELVLFETTTQPSIQPSTHNYDNATHNNNSFEVDFFSSINDPSTSTSPLPSKQNYINNGFEVDLFSSINAPSTSSSPLPSENNYINPFLQDTIADLNGTSGAHPSEGDLFGYLSTQTSFATDANASFMEGGFPGDLGLGVVSKATAQPFHADFGNGMEGFSAGFPTDLGYDRVNSAPPTFKAEFGNVNLDGNVNFSAGFPSDFDSGYTSFPQPTFHADFSNGNGNTDQNFSVGFYGDLGNTNANTPKLNHDSFGSGNLSPPAFQDNFGNSSAGVPAPVSPSGYSNGIAQPPFSADVGDGSANAMNAIVPFGLQGNDEFFTSGPRFQAAPTFRATSLDIDDQHRQSSLHYENNSFGSLPDTMPAVEATMSGSLDQSSLMQQQQLWLQNQNKIMARHVA